MRYMDGAVFGDWHIDHNCKISANSLLIDEDLDDNSIYIESCPLHVIKQTCGHDNISALLKRSELTYFSAGIEMNT